MFHILFSVSPPVDSQAMVDADMPGDVMDEMENMDEYKTSMVFMPPQPRKSVCKN
jgi:hypothetical protein